MIYGHPALPAMESHSVRRSPDPRIQLTFAFIEKNLDQPIRLTDLARLSGLSSARFSHLFARATGMTPGRYLRVLRSIRVIGVTRSRRAVPSPSSAGRRSRNLIRELD